MRSFLKFFISVVVCFLPSVLGALLSDPGSDWYRMLEKPFFTPPGWVFGPVWTVLYIMMGVSLFLLWRRGVTDRPGRVALLWFVVQLLLNAIWTPAFFGLESPILGLIVILLLWPAILLTIINLWRVSKIAGWLLIPYFIWVSYATVLNAAIVWIN